MQCGRCDCPVILQILVSVQDFFEFFNELNAYWVAPFVNVSFIVIAVLAQLYLSTPWGAAVSKPSHAGLSTQKAKTSTLTELEEQQLLPDNMTKTKGMQDSTAHNSTAEPASPAKSEHSSHWQNVSPRAMQLELQRLSPSSRSSSSMPRRRSQPHLPIHGTSDTHLEGSLDV